MSTLTAKTIVKDGANSTVVVKSVVTTGQRGPAGVIMQTTPPADTSVIWVDTSGL